MRAATYKLHLRRYSSTKCIYFAILVNRFRCNWFNDTCTLLSAHHSVARFAYAKANFPKCKLQLVKCEQCANLQTLAVKDVRVHSTTGREREGDGRDFVQSARNNAASTVLTTNANAVTTLQTFAMQTFITSFRVFCQQFQHSHTERPNKPIRARYALSVAFLRCQRALRAPNVTRAKRRKI